MPFSSFFSRGAGGPDTSSSGGSLDPPSHTEPTKNPVRDRPSRGTLARSGTTKRPALAFAVEEREHRPIFIICTVLLCTAITFLEVYNNGKDRAVDVVEGDDSTVTDDNSAGVASTEPGKCPMPFWIFCFEDLSTNPFLGPSTDTLLKMGAKTGHLIVEGNEWERLLKCIYLHGGLVHLVFNMSGLIQLGLPIERSYGTAKVMIIYFSAGIFGSIMSTIFDPNSVGVGASGAIFGLFGAAWGDLIQNWDLYQSPGWTLLSLLFGTAMNLGLGTTPILDNFAHFFGFVMGMLVSLGLLVVERQTAEGKHLKLSYWHYFLEFFPVVLVPFLFVMSVGVLFAGVAGSSVCPWCPHINCVPFPWGCDVHGSSCIFDCNTCASSGVSADASIYADDLTNATVTLHCPVLTDWTSEDTIDYVLKHQDVTNAGTPWLIQKCKEVCPDAFY